jgi:hypothetical protein
MPADGQKGARAPQSKESSPSEKRGPTAFKGPQVPASVLEDAQKQERRKDSSSAREEIPVVDLNSPAQPEPVDVATTDTGAELGGTPSSLPPTPDRAAGWTPHPEVRFDPRNPQIQAQTYIQPETGAVAEKLVGVEGDSPLRPAGSPLPVDASGQPSAVPDSAAAAADTVDTAAERPARERP